MLKVSDTTTLSEEAMYRDGRSHSERVEFSMLILSMLPYQVEYLQGFIKLVGHPAANKHILIVFSI